MGLLNNPKALLQTVVAATQTLQLQALVVTGDDPGLEEAAGAVLGVSPATDTQGPEAPAPGDRRVLVLKG